MRFIPFVVISGLLVVLSSCGGYHWGRGGANDSGLTSYKTLSIPYVEGDLDGSITSALVKQICSTAAFQYRPEGGSLILKVVVLGYEDDNIGYRYDRKRNGKLSKSIIPVEMRMTILTEVKMVEAISGQTILGPVKISANVDFDHDYYSSQNGINIFSLGQLSDVDEAQDAAQIPLNERLARKIAAYITDNW